MKIVSPDGKIVQTLFAVFQGDKQVTRWDPRKDKVISKFRRGHRDHSLQYTVRKTVFITPAKGGAS
jgi:hypothetical protein